ncbi:hypothetical protein HK101_001750 [Irineochytrium annulatum]|nr:hypothetical protein HK101_001750 [Irineochytrium annulatum]
MKQPGPPFSLPYEVWNRIFSHLDLASPRQFSLTCRWCRRIADDPHSRSAWLINKYGYALGLLHAFRGHRGVLTSEVGMVMVAMGCKVPRFLVQWVDKEYHRPDRTRKAVSAAIFIFFINAGYKEYGQDADFKEDVRMWQVETLTYPKLVSKLDISIIPTLIKNGLDLPGVNDLVMERVLWRGDISDAVLQTYLAVGFQLTPASVKKGLQMARPSTLEVLRARVAPSVLQRLAEETIVDMFGPSIRGWNFTPEALDFLMASFPISEEVMESAIFRIPGAPSDLPDSFPATRCYMKANPCPAWRWILRVYGPTHRFTMACFDDALSRAAAERDLHALHDVYIDAGVQFRPRHVKILACRVLHRDMTGNALHLLQVMRSQVVATFKDVVYPTPSSSSYSPASTLPTPPSSPVLSPIPGAYPVDAQPAKTHPTPADLLAWVRALRDEITENEEWDTRMRTTQLEGGPRGGAYRISRPPEDALRFLEEAKEFTAELAPPAAAAAAAVERGRGAKGAKAFRASVVGGPGRSSSERAPPPPPIALMSGASASATTAGRRRSVVGRNNSAPTALTPVVDAGVALAAGPAVLTPAGANAVAAAFVADPQQVDDNATGAIAAVEDPVVSPTLLRRSGSRNRGVDAFIRRVTSWWSHMNQRSSPPAWGEEEGAT